MEENRMPEMKKNWILGIALIISSVVLVAGCVIINTQAPAGATVPPTVTVPIVATTTPITPAPTSTKDTSIEDAMSRCQCDTSAGTCKELKSRLEALEYQPELRNCPQCMQPLPLCTSHCIFEIRRMKDEICSSIAYW